MDPWRMRCPKGHASVTLYGDSYLCEACDKSYDGEPYDAADTEFPVNEEPRAKTSREAILEELVRECEKPTKTRCRSRHLEAGSPSQVGRTLAELQKDGLVKKHGSGSRRGYWWQPTEKGRQKVIENERKAVLADRPKRARGQITPRAAGLMTMTLGLLWAVTTALLYGAVV